MDATDARAHVSLGKLLVQQRRYDEARALYEEASTATGGDNHSLQMLCVGRRSTQSNNCPDTCCASAEFMSSAAQRESYSHMSERRPPVICIWSHVHMGMHRCQRSFLLTGRLLHGRRWAE